MKAVTTVTASNYRPRSQFGLQAVGYGKKHCSHFPLTSLALGVMGPGGVCPVAKRAAGTSHPSLSLPDMMKSCQGLAKPVQETCERERGRVRSMIQPRVPEKDCGGT